MDEPTFWLSLYDDEYWRVIELAAQESWDRDDDSL